MTAATAQTLSVPLVGATVVTAATAQTLSVPLMGATVVTLLRQPRPCQFP